MLPRSSTPSSVFVVSVSARLVPGRQVSVTWLAETILMILVAPVLETRFTVV